ncbi:fungal-specific transcription factor domain-containing protein [Aspergillus heterothallicus]
MSCATGLVWSSKALGATGRIMSAWTGGHPDTPVRKRSCHRCNQRKVRCDRAHPCARCIVAGPGVECVYPESSKRAPRRLRRPPISELRAHLKELEGEVEELRASSNGVGDSEAYRGTAFLQHSNIMMLWQIYRERVAPLIPILHKPTIDLVVYEARANTQWLPPPASEALILSICFASVVSATADQCRSVTNLDRSTAVREYQLATKQALERANLIGTQDIRVLQAAVLYLLCLRAYGEFQTAWAQAAIVVRVAQKLEVHRDGQRLDLKPFDTEMRRRLWWHICILDMLCSEDQGTETQIHPAMFDTEFPVNFDGDDLSVEMDSPPTPRDEFTDITLCILHCEMMTNVRWAGKLPPRSSSEPYPPHDVPTDNQQAQRLSAFADRVEDQYLHRLNLDIPIQWLTAVIARLMLSQAWLAVHQPSSSAADKAETSGSSDEIFHMAVEMIKFANLLQSNERTAQWAWLCKSYKHQHVMAFILSEICLRPVDPETDHAWEVATEFYDMLLRGNHPADLMLQEPLSRLMERAVVSRAENGNKKKLLA